MPGAGSIVRSVGMPYDCGMTPRFWHAQWDRPNSTPRAELDTLESSLWKTVGGIALAITLLVALGWVIWFLGNDPLVWALSAIALLVTTSVGGLVWLSRKGGAS